MPSRGGEEDDLVRLFVEYGADDGDVWEMPARCKSDVSGLNVLSIGGKLARTSAPREESWSCERPQV